MRDGSSWPTNFFLPFSIASSIAWSSPSSERTKPQAWQMLRADRKSPASTSSFTAFAFAPGALNTGTPRRLSLTTGTLFVPAPARATASTLAGMSIECMSAERSMIASGWPISEAIS